MAAIIFRHDTEKFKLVDMMKHPDHDAYIILYLLEPVSKSDELTVSEVVGITPITFFGARWVTDIYPLFLN
jgi:hypothetical protein